MSQPDAVQFLILAFAVFIFFLFLGREIVCWYWKINQVIDELKLQNACLVEIRDELVAFRHERAANRRAA